MLRGALAVAAPQSVVQRGEHGLHARTGGGDDGLRRVAHCIGAVDCVDRGRGVEGYGARFSWTGLWCGGDERRRLGDSWRRHGVNGDGEGVLDVTKLQRQWP